MLRNYLVATFLLVLFSFPALSQSGTIRGRVIEDSSGEELIGVTVMVKGTTRGAVTDFEGTFEIKIEPGTYDLQVSFVSFETVTITGLTVESGEVTSLNGIRLKESVEELEAVTITAEVVRNSEAALLTVKRKSANLLDGISAAKFQKIGDSDAAGAVKRVTGVSVEGGKYVYVRGLGDRYTKTTLNNVDIPGLDPDRNSLQMDIFPTNLIDNMVVLKSSVAEMPADFTGGVVNIETKDFPDERIFNISAGVGYNPSMHFNGDYLASPGSPTDFLGFDNGARSLPAEAKNDPIPSPVSRHSEAEVNSFLKKFNPNLGAINQTSFMDYSLGLSLADQIGLRGNQKLGYIFSVSYKNSTQYYDDVIYGEYQMQQNPSAYPLRYATIQNGALGENNALLGGLAGLAYKTRSSKWKLTLMHLQNAESRAGQFFVDNDGEAIGQSGYFASSDNLDFSQRGLTNLLLNGEHYNDDGTWKIDWRVSPTFSSITDPDVRKTAFTMTAVDTTFMAGAGGNPSRIWRYLDEINLVGKVDITREYTLFGEPSRLKFGASHVYKERDYEILSYDMQFFGNVPQFGGNPDAVLQQENLFPQGNVYYISANNNPNPNAYNSNAHNTGIYVSNEFNPFSKLKGIIGLRGEKHVQRHTGRDVEHANYGEGFGNNLDNDKVLDAFDLFPSANLIYALTEEQNLRVSYSRTIARPSFKELSFAQILDPITNRYFNGGLFPYKGWDGNLTETRIHNMDVRWERFMRKGQLLSLSGFYKSFDDPIELVRIPEQQTSTEYQPRNVGDGQVFGVEVEFRKNLAFIAYPLERFSLNGNVTLVKSIIDMTSTEYNARKAWEREGQTIQDTRQMAGQAPYIINGGLSYDHPEHGFDAGLFYNVKGPTLTIVGGLHVPDVYTQPFHSLNFNLNKAFGPERRSSVSVNVSNLLGDAREEVYKSFEAQDQYFTRLNPGTAISIGLKHQF